MHRKNMREIVQIYRVSKRYFENEYVNQTENFFAFTLWNNSSKKHLWYITFCYFLIRSHFDEFEWKLFEIHRMNEWAF